MTPQQKRHARAKAWRAQLQGRLVKQPCRVCGTTARVEAHHPNGYEPSKELDVEWLCRTHHMNVHTSRVPETELLEAIQKAGSPEKAAPLLGVSRRTIYRWMEFYGITRTYARAA